MNWFLLFLIAVALVLTLYGLLRPIYNVLCRIAYALEELPGDLPLNRLVQAVEDRKEFELVARQHLARLSKAAESFAANGFPLSNTERQILIDDFNQRLIDRTQGFLRRMAKDRAPDAAPTEGGTPTKGGTAP